MILGPDQHLAPLYRRSPFQVALLLVFTGGLYLFYWAFKVRRWCEVTLEKPNQSLWKTIALVVPIFNLFLLYDLGLLIKGVGFRARVPVSGAVAMFGILAFFVGLLGRLPTPYWTVTFFAFVPLTMMYFPFERAQLAIVGSAALPQRFIWFEYLIIILGAVFWGLVLLGLNTPNDDGTPIPNPAFAYASSAGVIAALVATKMYSDKLLKVTAQNEPANGRESAAGQQRGPS
jgi:hypothetical protein